MLESTAKLIERARLISHDCDPARTLDNMHKCQIKVKKLDYLEEK